MRPGLGTIRALLGELGDPQRAFRSVHVTGSKGKGSVAAMIASILERSGRTVGLFTSPHLVSYRERIRVDGRPIPAREVTRGIARIEAATQALLGRGAIEHPPTFFETTTALAFDWFKERGVDAGVIEVGIGGRLDSTNVLDSAVGVITTIELEHTDILGSTLEEIAREKAGILHPGMRAIVGELPEEARRTIDRAADALGVPVWHLGETLRVGPRTVSAAGQRFSATTPWGEIPNLSIPLAGPFQASNALLALAAARQFGEATDAPVPDRAVLAGLRAVRWRGRLERIRLRPLTYLDVAHTPQSAAAVASGIAELHPFADPSESVVLFGCLVDKHADEMLEVLAPLATTVVLARVRSDRASAPADLARRAIGRFPRIVQAPTVGAGYALARASVGPNGLLLAVGSDYLVGEVLESIEGRAEGEPDLSDPVGPGLAPPTAAGRASTGGAR